MAKKIINSYYTLDVLAGTITLPEFVKLDDLFLITNVSTNDIIYNFADSAAGGSVVWSEETETTTLTLDMNINALGTMTDSDRLQIIIDEGNSTVNVDESLLDPVHKLRVSTPENLIDTDFEYGLQPTKWETVELLNNVPSFYTSDGDLSLSIVTTVESVANSDLITVFCNDIHGLPVGTPIDVQGLSSRTAEGKFLISSTPTTESFTYRSNGVQTSTGILGSIYTTITPGTFYTGSQIPFEPTTGITTDEAEPSSVITVNTQDPHGFETGNQFYLLNSVGGKSIKFTDTATDTASDGRPFVDFVENLDFSLTPDLTRTETKMVKSRWSHKFFGSDVDTSANTITWVAHGMLNNDVVFYLAPANDTAIGGLGVFYPYYVKKITDDTISLTRSRSGSAISLTSGGTNYFGRHSLHLAYEIKRNYYPAYNQYGYQYTAAAYYGNGSGWDIHASYYTSGGLTGYNGLGYTAGQTVKMFPTASTNAYHRQWQQYQLGSYDYSPRWSGNFQYNSTSGLHTPNQYNPFEDFTRFQNGAYSSYAVQQSNGQIRSRDGYYTGPYNRYYRAYNFYPSNLTEFYIPIVDDDEADTFFSTSHGMSTGDTVTISTASATYGGYSGTNLMKQHTGSTSQTNTTALSDIADATYGVDVVSADRFKLSGLRLASASGSYTFAGEKKNPTANSWYIPDHGLDNSTNLTVSAVDGGVLPTATSGQILPNSSGSSSGTNINSWGVLNTAISAYLDANTAGPQNMVTSTNENSTRVFDSGVASGNSSLNWYDLWYTTNNGNYSSGGSYTTPRANLYMKNLSSTRAHNILSGTNFSNRNNLVVATDWTANSTLPYYFWTRESGRLNAAEYWYGYFRDGCSYPSQGSMGYSSAINNQSFTVNGNDYRYSLTAQKHERTGCNSTVYIRGHFQNISDWQIYNNNTSMTLTTNNNTYGYGYWSGSYRWKDIIEFGLVFSLGESDTAFESTADYTAWFESILTSFDVNYIYPDLISGNIYNTDVLTSDRFALNSQGVSVNITDGGTGAAEFVTKAELGVVDGTYKATFREETSFDFPASTKVFGATIDLDATSVDADYIIKVNLNADHTLISGTAVTYSNNGNPTLANLVNDTEYYAVSIDEQHIALCATLIDAENNDNYIQIAAGTGVHKITTASISGVAEADGQVEVEVGSNVIKGTTTLFKRYFKVGDTVYVKDASTTPGALAKRIIISIADDTKMTTDRNFDFAAASTKHFLETKVYVKPDGYSVHRPFDGGVEIAAGTSPYSQVTRQTRKYFRYQSGKGIQTSLAINFNPPVTLEKLVSVSGIAVPSVSYNVSSTTGAYVWADQEPVNNPILTLYRGGTYTINLSASGHPFYITTDDGTNYAAGSYVGEYTSGVTGSRTETGTITFVVPSDAPDTLYYQCGVHSAMLGTILIMDFNSTVATATTKYPHRLSVNSQVKIKDAADASYNISTNVTEIVDDFNFKYGISTIPSTNSPAGIIKFNLDGYTGSAIRAGMFDFQNGFFFEFDGQVLWAVRRSSTEQLSGTASVINNSGLVTGDSMSNFTGQLSVNDMIVLRGQSYKIVKISSKNQLYVQPQFKGPSTNGVIITKTVDVRVPQSDWNIDKCDGTGEKGFLLDINKIQMAYMDYSWYGAGKIRFGFKDRHGHVRYCHSFLHNNRMDEAYMRSGNLPAKYEIENGPNPDYAPTLFHWGTSVIMDGTFDDDKAYLFTAPSKSLSFTNGESSAVTTTGNSSIIGTWTYSGGWSRDWHVRIPVAGSSSDSFYSGLKLYTTGGELSGQEVAYTQFSGSTFYLFIFVGRSRNQPAIYPIVPNSTALSLGAPPAGGDAGDIVNLGTDIIPLVSLRLAPSVDSNLSGNLGERDIINRMQLKLAEVGLILTHDCEVKLIINGDLSTIDWSNVSSPSLSQLIKHEAGDSITGGTEVFSFRAAGGSVDSSGRRLSNASNFSLGDIIDMGNSILGGNGIFPNGPDIITVAARVVDTGGIGASQPFTTSARITWTESQA